MIYTDIPVIETRTKKPVARFMEMAPAMTFCADMRTYKIAFDEMDAKVWQAREAARFASKVYTPLPEYIMNELVKFPPPPEVASHFAHVSANMEGIAYIASHDHGVLDRQTVTAPGRYLTRFYPKLLSENRIRELASEFAQIKTARYELKFGREREDFKRVYLGGDVRNPGSAIYSCMGGAFEHLPAHPCEAYAGGDLAIAYIEDKGKITARSVVYPDKLMAAYVYGATNDMRVIMEEKLRLAGYTKRPPFIGARLLKIPHPKGGANAFIMPHIDSDDSFVHHPDSPEHFLIVERSPKNNNRATTTAGYMAVD